MRKTLTKILFATIIMLLVFETSESRSCAAASYKFKYKEYCGNTKIKYNGTIPNYMIDGVSVSLEDTPGIINEKNWAMCNAEEVFKAAGVSVKASSKKITFKYKGNKLVLYLNTDKAEFNGAEVQAPCVSYKVKYSATGRKVIFVPSRFVAETLGMYYNWNQNTKTAEIKTPIKLKYDDEVHLYNGSQGSLKVNGENVDNSDYPSIIISDNALLALEPAFSGLDEIEFSYSAKTGQFDITCGDISIRMMTGSTLVYVNGLLKTCPVAPRQIKNYETGTKDLYFPGRFVFETLGYRYTWDNASKTSVIEYVDGKTGVFIQDYEIVALYDTADLNGDDIDTSDRYAYHQELYLLLPDEIDPEEAEFEQLLYDNTIRLELDGDYRDFYRENPIENTGEAVMQANVLYYKDTGITEINLITRSDENRMILGYKYEHEPVYSSVRVIMDKPKNLFQKVIVLDAGHGGSDPGTRHGGYDEKDINFSLVYKYCKKLFDECEDVKVYYSRYDDTLPSLYTRAGLAARLGADLFISVHHNSNDNKNIAGTSVYYSTEDTGTYPALAAQGDPESGETEVYEENAAGTEDAGMENDPESSETKAQEGETISTEDGLDTEDAAGAEDGADTEDAAGAETSGTEMPEKRSVLTGKIMAGMMQKALVKRLKTKDLGIIDKNFVVVGKNNTVPAVLLEIGFMSNPDELKRIVKPSFQKKAAKAIYDTVMEIYRIY